MCVLAKFIDSLNILKSMLIITVCTDHKGLATILIFFAVQLMSRFLILLMGVNFFSENYFINTASLLHSDWLNLAIAVLYNKKMYYICFY